MNASIQRLRAELRSDRQSFTAQVELLVDLELNSDSSPGDLALAAVALHHAHSAIERGLQRVARLLE